MFKKIIKNKLGVSLLEMVVAVAVFSVVVLLATQIFKMVLESQRNSIASQNMQESIMYTFETMAKEIRMAQKDEGGTCAGSEHVYSVNEDGDKLSFINYHGDCVFYYLNNGQLMVDRGVYSASTTPKSVKVSNLKFLVNDNIGITQSLVVLKMDIEAIIKGTYKQKMTIQTTISSRHYE